MAFPDAWLNVISISYCFIYINKHVNYVQFINHNCKILHKLPYKKCNPQGSLNVKN
jgi:hypothetical protein